MFRNTKHIPPKMGYKLAESCYMTLTFFALFLEIRNLDDARSGMVIDRDEDRRLLVICSGRLGVQDLPPH